MSSLDRSNTTISDLYKGLDVITQLLKDIHNAVKDDPTANQKLNEATETFARIFSNITKVLSLVKGFDFSALLSTMKDLQAHALKQEEASAAWTKQDTSEIKSMMAEIYQAFKGQPASGSVTPTLALTHILANVEGENATNTATEEPPSHTKGETGDATMEIPISSIQPTHAQSVTPIISHPESSQATLRIDKGKGIATESKEDPSKRLVPASTIIRPDLDEPVRDKEEKMKKAVEEAKLLAMSRPEVIKVVQEKAEKIRLGPRKFASAKAGEKFKKAQDAEHEVLKREHSKKIKRLTELNRRRAEEYMWTMTNRIKPEPITDVRIHPNTKPIVASVFRNNDKRNFDVHQPFKFSDFGITELDELGPIIQKKKNSVVKDLMTSLSKRYERLKKIPKELGIQSALPAPVPEQASSQTSGRKRKHMELEPEVKVHGLECNRSLPEGVPFVNNMDDIHKVEMDSLVSYLVMASIVKTKENARFSLKLRKLITDHPDQEKLKSKKVKLEALGYHNLTKNQAIVASYPGTEAIKRNFDVHQPFRFSDFGITELDELGPIIQKKKNSVVKDLMTSLSKRYERLKRIPEELGIQSALFALVPETSLNPNLRKKRSHIGTWNLKSGASVGLDVLGDLAFKRWDDIYKVGIDSLISYMVMASMVKTKENARFSLKLRKMIAGHPDQDKLNFTQVKVK
ncbi:hypothetical protein Tco_0603225 [Tanacetum coccineum]